MQITNFSRWLLGTLLSLFLHFPAAANLVGDWGVIAVGSESTFTFTLSGSSTNFSDEYAFTLAGSTDINYFTNNFLATCTKGCGNPVVEFGIYNASGSLIDASGATTLEAGSYVFQVKGTGMGAGNTAGSGGIISFYSEAPELVSPAPEPSSWLLMLSGLALLAGLMRRRSRKSSYPAGVHAR